MPADKHCGILFIGDPHLEGRQPGFRRDDYAVAILDKLAWCFDYAREEQLLPALLGDLFDKPRDNPNWMLVRMLELLREETLALYGNHDVHYNPQLTDDDSLALLVRSGRLTLVAPESPWRGKMNGRDVIIGGSSYRQPLPTAELIARLYGRKRRPAGAPAPLCVWMTHHDILIPGYDEGRIKPCEIPGVELMVNGHIHRRLEPQIRGGTTWLTPGNIARRVRSEAVRSHVPSVLRVDVAAASTSYTQITVPHQPFDEVFHPAVLSAEVVDAVSPFVAGLQELQARRTATGAGLQQFLADNLSQFKPEVAEEIRRLADLSQTTS